MRKSGFMYLAVLVIVSPRIPDAVAAITAGILLIAALLLQWLGD